MSHTIQPHLKRTQPQLKLEATGHARIYQPRKPFGLRVTGNPGATVGLVAVDKGVYVLNNKHRLNQKKAIPLI